MKEPSKSHTQELMDELLSIFPERLLKLNNEEQRVSLRSMSCFLGVVLFQYLN